uniref:Uncharacterized protein n=1 Tax=Acrobeloides nanus TaxID=290746 RepID=A0A914D8E4_9BILA
MMEICSSTDDQFYSDKLFEEIENSIQLVQIETQKFEANVYICFEQIQHFGNQLVQSTYNFDEDQYNQVFNTLGLKYAI